MPAPPLSGPAMGTARRLKSACVATPTYDNWFGIEAGLTTSPTYGCPWNRKSGLAAGRRTLMTTRSHRQCAVTADRFTLTTAAGVVSASWPCALTCSRQRPLSATYLEAPYLRFSQRWLSFYRLSYLLRSLGHSSLASDDPPSHPARSNVF